MSNKKIDEMTTAEFNAVDTVYIRLPIQLGLLNVAALVVFITTAEQPK